ncbi:hypothetical protein BD770DRAFT_380139 [Pilaira anomala]|nr:hypothetical protein BD770DRAFT_380139 [Pilaira anomala]
MSRSTEQQLNTEYEKLDKLRSEQCQSLQSQWETYKNEQKQYRKKDIESRQVEFDKELAILDNKRRQKWKNNDSLEDLSKKELSHQLLKKLEGFDLEQGETNTGNILRLPTDFLELFWLLEIDMPITKAEILEATDQIKKKLKEY